MSLGDKNSNSSSEGNREAGVKHAEHLQKSNMAGSGCCGLPLWSWYPSSKKELSTGKTMDMAESKKSSNDRNSQSMRSNLYKLFSCDTPNFCSCGTCMFCDSSYANKKTLKGRKAPNTVYTEVVISEPKPRGSCFGWYDKEEPATREQISSKVSPIVKRSSLNCNDYKLKNLARADSEEIINKSPCGSRDSGFSDFTDAGNTSQRISRRSPVIPWNTEFKGKTVIIEDLECDELSESEVLFGQPLTDLVSKRPEDEDDECDPRQVSEEYRICFVESEADDQEGIEIRSGNARQDDENTDDICNEMVEIPLTPYSVGSHSWNGRLELMEELGKSK